MDYSRVLQYVLKCDCIRRCCFNSSGLHWHEMARNHVGRSPRDRSVFIANPCSVIAGNAEYWRALLRGIVGSGQRTPVIPQPIFNLRVRFSNHGCQLDACLKQENRVWCQSSPILISLGGEISRQTFRKPDSRQTPCIDIGRLAENTQPH